MMWKIEMVFEARKTDFWGGMLFPMMAFVLLWLCGCGNRHENPVGENGFRVIEELDSPDKIYCIVTEYCQNGDPLFESVDIGEFSGDRKKDIDKMLTFLKEEYKINEIPAGYVVHHNVVNGVLQLVEESIHKKFTHLGGYSLYK